MAAEQQDMGAYIARINSMSEGDSGVRSGSAINSGNDFSNTEAAAVFQAGGEGIGTTIGSSSQPLGFLNSGGLLNLGEYSVDNIANFVEGGSLGQNPTKVADGNLAPFGVSSGPILGETGFVGNVELSSATSLGSNLNAKLPKISSGGQSMG